MRIVSIVEARDRLESVLDGVFSHDECTVIARPDAEDAVVMSLDYYNSLMETVHPLKSPANAANLATSNDQHRSGRATEHDTVDE